MSRFTIRRRLIEVALLLWVAAYFGGFMDRPEQPPEPTPSSPFSAPDSTPALSPSPTPVPPGPIP
jgi:hypothetical protein